MSLFVFGVNHNTAPVAIREKVAFVPAQLPTALTAFVTNRTVNEAVILSTCNRTEIYCDIVGRDCTALIGWLVHHHGLTEDELGPAIFTYSGDEAVGHLLRVACGLDSMVLGEPQILGQIKSAYQVAGTVGTTGKVLSKLFQHGFSVAKQVRTDTAIGNSPISVAFAAIRLAQRVFADLSQRQALLVGAGDTIELSAYHLHNVQLGGLVVANRSAHRAQAIASQYAGQAISLAQIPEHLSRADIVISSTASTAAILTKQLVERALKERKHRPMFMVDLAVPRDIEPAVGQLDDVYLYTIDDLETVIEENQQSRKVAAHQANEIVDTQVRRYADWLRSLDGVPTIRALRGNAKRTRDDLVSKAKLQLVRGDDPAEVVDTLARLLTNKLIHTPTQRLSQVGAQGREDLLKVARELFGLDDPDDPDGPDDA